MVGRGGWAEIKWFNASNIQIGGTGLINLLRVFPVRPIMKSGIHDTGGNGYRPEYPFDWKAALAAYNILYVDDVCIRADLAGFAGLRRSFSSPSLIVVKRKTACTVSAVFFLI